MSERPDDLCPGCGHALDQHFSHGCRGADRECRCQGLSKETLLCRLSESHATIRRLESELAAARAALDEVPRLLGDTEAELAAAEEAARQPKRCATCRHYDDDAANWCFSLEIMPPPDFGCVLHEERA